MLRAAVWLALIFLAPAIAQANHATGPIVYHSPNDDGAPAFWPPQVPLEPTMTLHLYIDGGSVPSPSGS